MTEPYPTEDQKMVKTNYPKWNFDQQASIHNILKDKGYVVNCVSRVGCDREYHDAWQVDREDIPRLIEELFRQRIVVEVQAEGNHKASINFCYDYHADTILAAVERFRKNKRGDA